MNDGTNQKLSTLHPLNTCPLPLAYNLIEARERDILDPETGSLFL